MSSASRTNGRPALPISKLPALNLDLPPAGSAWLVCPDCHHWVEVVRGLVQTHSPDGRRCTGSAQTLDFDLSPAQHAARRVAARAELHSGQSSAPTVRTARAAFTAAPKQAARRVAVRIEQDRAESAARPTVKVRTAMTAAFEDAWLKVKRVPGSAPVHQIAARSAA